MSLTHIVFHFNSERKIFPLALVNYITLSGGGFARESGAKLRNLTMDELIKAVCSRIQIKYQKQFRSSINNTH